MHLSLTFAVVLAACSTAPHPAPIAAKPTSPPAPVAAPPIAAKPALQRLMAGGWPGSNTHEWGTRFYELRLVPAGASGTSLELRLHDEIDFQGSGRRPDQMPPTRHACSTWEPLPAAIRVPASARSCDDAKAECAAIDQHLRATAPTPTPHDPRRIMTSDHTFGRAAATCT
jgi:hypothetical protein